MKSKKSQIKKLRPLRLFSGVRKYDANALIGLDLNNQKKLHAVGRPAIRFDDGAEEWWTRGHLQSQEDFPAVFIEDSNAGVFKVGEFGNCSFHEQLVLTPSTSVWCEDGFIHRDGAPAIINYGTDDLACEQWWKNGFRHRVNGPAYTSEFADMWFEDGLLHRVDAPAIEAKNHAKSKVFHNLSNSWCWHGAAMVKQEVFNEEFDYSGVPPAFILRALAYVYEQSGTAVVCDKAVERASEIFPDLGVILGAVSGTDECGVYVAARILSALGGEVDDTEVYSVEGLLEEE